jgi:hypothetical protein
MSHRILEKLELQKMASGHLCLELTEAVAFEDFPKFADEFLSTIGATVLHRLESFDLQIWDILLSNCEMRLVFEDFPVMVSIRSTSDEGDQILRKLRDKLKSMSTDGRSDRMA